LTSKKRGLHLDGLPLPGAFSHQERWFLLALGVPFCQYFTIFPFADQLSIKTN
jgi:hypothetical protein